MSFPDPVIEMRSKAEVESHQEKMSAACSAWRPRIRLSASKRISKSRPERSEGHGRASSRHPDRPPAARVQALRANIGQTDGGVSRKKSRRGRDRLHAQKQSGGTGQFRAASKLQFEPLRSRFAASSFENHASLVFGGRRNTYLGVEKGLNMAKKTVFWPVIL